MEATAGNLITFKQLEYIRSIANGKAINARAEAMKVYGVEPERLNRRAASDFINYLQAEPRRWAA